MLLVQSFAYLHEKENIALLHTNIHEHFKNQQSSNYSMFVRKSYFTITSLLTLLWQMHLSKPFFFFFFKSICVLCSLRSEPLNTDTTSIMFPSIKYGRFLLWQHFKKYFMTIRNWETEPHLIVFNIWFCLKTWCEAVWKYRCRLYKDNKHTWLPHALMW